MISCAVGSMFNYLSLYFQWIPLMKDGRLNTGDFLLPVSVDKLPSRYSLLNPDVSKQIKKHKTLSYSKL